MSRQKSPKHSSTSSLNSQLSNFGKESRLHKIFNRNNVKVSYSCMKNMERIIKSHNAKIISGNNRQPTPRCNCQPRAGQRTCPLEGSCRTPNIVYAAEVVPQPAVNNQMEPPLPPTHARNLRRRTTQANSTQSSTIDHETTNNTIPNAQNQTLRINTVPRFDNSTKTYIGLAEDFKARYRNHLKSFRNEIYEKETELSKYIWQLKRSNINFNINWKILKKTTGFNPISRSCTLCLAEKLAICSFPNKNNLINKRSELISKCRHENKFLLVNTR